MVNVVHGIRLILILAVIGGLIAYLGDKVGMRIGRRRLTLFGLRPKHTSILITIVTGILIVAISLTMLSIASEDVRTALFRMQELQQTLATTRVQYDGVVGELAQRQSELERTQAQRDAATAELDAAEERLSLIGAEYDAAVADLREAEDSLEFTRQRVGNLQQIGAELQMRIDEMQALVADMEVDILVKEAQIRAATLQLDQIRGGELAFRSGDIVLASIFEAGRSADVVRAHLLQLLERADLMAVQRGARLEAADVPTALQLLDGVFTGTVQMLTQTPNRWIVRVVSIYNTTVGEPVAVDLELVEEKLIYKAGEVIVEAVVEGSGSGVVRDELIRLLQSVYDAASSRGMLTDEEGFVSEGISLREFVDTLSIIEQMGGQVTVRAVAVEDTVNTNWPLRIRLEIQSTP